ncbi:hypothetical protein F4778DRAFT_330244 [Xylariomycetidae sp. FL2044]|nr:hypothetical protein F4778DRAFT_330244 [Xylariomycetidae sp. FL2044]
MVLALVTASMLITVSIAQDLVNTRADVGCGFHVSTSGGFSGAVGQIGSGQARASTAIAPSLFTWFGDAFVDQQGRGCWWTPPTAVLQCDMNQQPDHGFQIGCDGSVSYNGQSVFYECQTGDDDQVNIYLQPSAGNCSQITMKADNCLPNCSASGAGPSPQSSSPSSSASGGGITPTPFTTGPLPSSTPPTTTGPSSSSSSSSSPSTTSSSTTSSTIGCINRPPKQIILIDEGNPDTAYGPNPGSTIQVSPNASSIFNFETFDSDVGKTCEMFWTLGTQMPPHNLTGTRWVSFETLDGWADADTSYNSAPRTEWPLDVVQLRVPMEFDFGDFDCPGSTARISVIVKEAPYADTCLECQQQGGGNDGGGPMSGLFMAVCP